jgi:hypothetical protein
MEVLTLPVLAAVLLRGLQHAPAYGRDWIDFLRELRRYRAEK